MLGRMGFALVPPWGCRGIMVHVSRGLRDAARLLPRHGEGENRERGCPPWVTADEVSGGPHEPSQFSSWQEVQITAISVPRERGAWSDGVKPATSWLARTW